MARVLEDNAKRLIANFGLPVPSGHRVATPARAKAVASSMPGGCVVKALVPTGRRGKAGLVEVCSTVTEAEAAAQRMLTARHGEYRIDAVLVEERIEITHEYYLSISIDPVALSFAVLVSPHGGVDIEDSADTVTVAGISPLDDISRQELVSVWRTAGCDDHAELLGDVTRQALEAFRQLDATLLEINPLAIDESGRAIAVGTMLAIDDAALQRHADLAPFVAEGSDRASRPETDLELRVAALNADRSQRGSARYLELDGGNIGFLCGGGGASLLLFDALVSAGGTPANYSEFGGNPTEQRVYDLTRVVLDKPGVLGLFVAHNITNNTQVDVVARGVTNALRDAGVPDTFPVVAREVGVNDEEGRRIFEAVGVQYLGADVSLNRAASVMVERMREALER
jgi:succinyl-CoA synthetase beta subunit